MTSLENLQYSYLDKFQVLQGPCQIPPHKCAGCGRALVSSDDTWVDWNFDVEFYGQVIICTDCFRQAANQIGFMGPDQWTALSTERDDLYTKLEELSHENMRLRDALGSLGLIGVTPVDSDLSDVGEVEESIGDSEGDDTAVAAEPGPDEQDASPGSSELSGNDALNELIAGI